MKHTHRHFGVLHGIEIVRFVAAFGVAIFHYIHFQYNGTDPTNINFKSQPLYPLLKAFYSFGGLGVPLFWAVSGVVFFHVYGNISPNSKFAKNFWINRLSRLVPLHWLSLLIVIFLQVLANSFLGYSLIYPVGNPYEVLGNALLISHWFTGSDGQILNGPIWSVSVELLVYVVFFATFWSPKHLRHLASAFAFLFFAFCNFFIQFDWPFLEAAGLFFFGATLYQVFSEEFIIRRLLLKLLVAEAVSIGMMCAVTFDGTELQIGVPNLVFYIALPMILVAAIGFQAGSPLTKRLFEKAGSVTYSIYLLHVPLQMTMILFCRAMFGSVPYNQVIFLVLYMTLLISLSGLTYKYFEVPMKLLIRNLLRS